jgi:Tfp pilus assembly protein PilE
MKRKIIIAVIAVVALLVICAFASAYHAAKTISQYEATASDVGSLAVMLEDFRDEHGQYPASLGDTAPQLDARFQESERHILHDKWSDRYEYHPLATGFVIVARGFRFEYQSRTNGYVIMGRFTTNVVTIR